MTSQELPLDETDADIVLAPATPGAQALPTNAGEDDEPSDPASSTKDD